MEKNPEKSQIGLLPPVKAAGELSVSYTRLNSWRKLGCPCHRVQDGLRMRSLFNVEEVRAWAAQRAAGKGVGA